MNIVDGVIVALLVGGASLGFYWGAIRNLLALLGLLVGLLLSQRLGPPVGAWLTSFIVNDYVAQACGVALVVLAVGAVSSLIASALRLYVGLLCLGRLDHILGAVLGLCHVIVSCGVVGALAAALRYQPWAAYALNSSLLASVLSLSAPLLQLLGEPLRGGAQGLLIR